MTAETLVLDSQALRAIVRKDRRIQVILAAARQNDRRTVVPAVVLAEVMTGGPGDAAYWHTVGRLVLTDTTPSIAARAGALRERATAVQKKKRDLTVDAIVTATAQEFAPSIVTTGNPADMTLLAPRPDVRVLAV
ncbi:MAG: twitching motility protein PilT [Micrococcales bacterium]|nr:twitching motility protein PilT [Micrococcales bacterium]MCL2666177.1 twitching motility protein PilT [Micrococcales bacterium]